MMNYLQVRAIYHSVFAEEEKARRKAALKNVNRDFYQDLPSQVCSMLDDFCWTYKEQPWFEEAWEKYRKHVLDAGLGGKIKMPGFVFNEYIDRYVAEQEKKMKKDLVHMDVCDVEELYHHGIKGQKWGFRRFQNEDGTLTEAGKARYNSDGSSKDPRKMSDEDLRKSNARLSAESQYRQLTGTTQPGRAFNRDTAIKMGATFLATGAATFLLRKYKTGNWIGKGAQGRNAKGRFTKKKLAVGAAVTTALLAGGIGAMMAGASSLGGSARPESNPKEGKFE